MSESNSSEQDALRNPTRAPTNFGQSVRGARRLLPWVAALFIVVVVGIFWLSGGRHDEKPRSAAFTPPQLPVPAGGENNSAVMDKTTRDADRAAAEKAKREHSSYASPIQGNSPTGSGDGELGDTPMDKTRGAAAEEKLRTDDAPPAASAAKPGTTPDKASTPGAGAAAAPKSEAPALGFTVDDNATPSRPPRPDSLSDAQKAELFALWGGHPARLDVVLKGNADGAGNTGASTSTSGFASPSSAADGTGSVSQTASSATSSVSVTQRKMLLRGGRGIYGHAVLTVNSDLGSDVLLEADSGPFAGARMTGTFTMQSDLLVIKITKLMIDDNPPIAVNAFVVAPDSGESGVATQINEHLVTRVALPAAAAFVQGLGTALQNNNTQSYTAGLGLTSFTHYTLPQQLGMAAGAVGQNLGQFLQKQTPQKATAKLTQGAAVGIVFLEPVYAP
ncbi:MULTISPECIES: DotG/IcmE/VirB10 family protein [Asaia]|nr:DotG/IcmE/VirB10 family protein [Asaia spathodeae]